MQLELKLKITPDFMKRLGLSLLVIKKNWKQYKHVTTMYNN